MLLAEIAREACVSPATVSRAINQPHIVSPEKLARIRAVIQRFNYVPLPVEQRRGPKARLGTQRRVGVWFVGTRTGNPNLDWFQQQVLKLQASDVHYRMDLRLMASATPADIPRALQTEKLDGLIVQGMEPDSACLKHLEGKPHVWFMTRRSLAYPGDYIEPNNEENGRLAAEYLKERSHKVVAVVATDPDYSAIGRRTQAFIHRAQELGLKVHTILGTPHHSSYLQIASVDGEMVTLASRFLACTPRATGVYLPADHFCGALFRALANAGRKPGRDFEAVLGNYNPAIYRLLDHSPAVIDINLPMLVRKVVDHLLWRIENPKVSGRVGVSISPRLFPPASLPLS